MPGKAKRWTPEDAPVATDIGGILRRQLRRLKDREPKPAPQAPRPSPLEGINTNLEPELVCELIRARIAIIRRRLTRGKESASDLLSDLAELEAKLKELEESSDDASPAPNESMQVIQHQVAQLVALQMESDQAVAEKIINKMNTAVSIRSMDPARANEMIDVAIGQVETMATLTDANRAEIIKLLESLKTANFDQAKLILNKIKALLLNV